MVIDKRERPGVNQKLSLLSYYGDYRQHDDNDNNSWKPKKEFESYVRFDTLDCGDVCFFKDDQPVILIERKDIKDLASCIQSKSYKEQKTRMLKFKSNHPNLKLIYLIEAFPLEKLSDLKTVVNPRAPKSVQKNKQIILSAIVSTMLRDDFYVMITQGTEGSIAFLDRIYKKYPTYPAAAAGGVTEEDGKLEYLKQIHIKKHKNITPNAWFLYALSQIPNVSVDKAKSIQDVYKTMPNLLKAYNELTSEKEKAALLCSIDGIGKVLSNRIYQYLHGEHAD
jgi:ERCC4-type nuclease